MGPDGKAQTILVVEDNSLMRKLFVRCLEEGGYRVIEAEDPRTVIARMRAAAPDLVVMDIVMPNLSGVELIRQIRNDRALAATPVLALTNLATTADRRRLVEAGFDGHISKPITPKDFLTTVAGILGAAVAMHPA